MDRPRFPFNFGPPPSVPSTAGSSSPFASLLFAQFLHYQQRMFLIGQMSSSFGSIPLSNFSRTTLESQPSNSKEESAQMVDSPTISDAKAEDEKVDIVTIFPRIVTCSPSTARSSEQSSPNSSTSPSPHQDGKSPKLTQKVGSALACPSCDICGKNFARQWLLQGHLRTHTGEKPFKCAYCPKSFADKSNKRAHEQTHSGIKPFVCPRCGKSFALKSYLSKHEESKCQKIHIKFPKAR